MKHLYLVGNMGSGKSVVGKAVAERLALPFYDLDALIEQRVGATVSQIFEREGESAFRDSEQAVLREVSQSTPGVVATGGGVVLREANRERMRQTGWVIYLKASPETLWQRLQHSTHRPLLRTPAPRQTLEQIVQEREPLYQEADWILDADSLTPEQAAEQVIRAYQPAPSAPLTVRVLPGQPREYEVRLAAGLHAHAARMILERVRPTRVVIFTHPVLHRKAQSLQSELELLGVPTHILTLRSGERTKSLYTAAIQYEQMLILGMDRSGLVVILGGGVLGDLGGFVAATYMRGIPYVQIPTTLLAQVDSSVGGKVAVDMPQGKNLVGTFHQPALVLIDPTLLRSLPARQWCNGFAEMLKYGIALQRGLWRRLQTMLAQAILTPHSVQKAAGEWLLPIAQCVNLKAQIVSEDERDITGRRALLNFGHTVGHAIEAALGYQRWLHGEAIAVGMVAEAELGHLLGITPREVVEELRATVAQAGLPLHLPPGVSAETLLDAMRYDKKRAGDSLSVVVLEAVGKARVEPNIPLGAMRAALERCTTS
ncbi:MAG: 3-dehydroquinate synthase [Fimbriimonadales bacterium]|nr:3-dehydroquinate synthase [Fimbriimonadales bacterium]